MRYVLLIYNEERNWTTLSPEERAALGREYYACTARMMESGASAALEPASQLSESPTVAEHRAATAGEEAESNDELEDKPEHGTVISLRAASRGDAVE